VVSYRVKKPEQEKRPDKVMVVVLSLVHEWVLNDLRKNTEDKEDELE
jgi:hypothetical protein